MAEQEIDQQWLTYIFISAYVFLILYLTVKVMHTMHSRTRRINRLSLVPFYIVIMCYTTAVTLLCIAALHEDDDGLQEKVNVIYSFVTSSFICAVLLTMTVHWDLLSALLVYQHTTGPSQALVRRDEHFEHERRILKRYLIFAAIIAPVRLSEMAFGLVENDLAIFVFVIIGLSIAVVFFFIIIVSYIKLRRRLKLYYADAYQDHKWRLIAEVSFCIFGVTLSIFSSIA